MKKKVLSAILVAAMAVSMAACGSTSSSTTTDSKTSEATSEAAGSEAAATDAASDTDWPTGTVSVVVPYKAGGDTDTYCRALFQAVGEKLGQTFVVTNEEGGSGMVAAMDVMNKANDGYTILFNHTGASLVQEATGTAEFSYTDDFTNCCTVVQDSSYALMCVSPDGEYGKYSRGWTCLEDMIADAKENPGVIRYSTVFGSTTEYVGKCLESEAGIEFDNIDVGTSTGDRLAALLGGQIELVAVNYMNVADYVNSGDLICLGVMSEEPVEGIDTPTFIEQGYNVVNAKKYEVKFPKGTDQAIVQKLADACEEVVNSDEFAETVKSYYASPYWRDAETMNTEDPEEVKELAERMASN